MADDSVRVDPVTGSRVSFFSAAGKPAGQQTRTLVGGDGPCAFCEIAEQVALGSASAWANDHPRPILAASSEAFVMPNRWSSFGAPPQGFAELVLPFPHHTSPQDFSSSEWESCLRFAHRRYEKNRPDFRDVYVSMNVGREAGASMAHAHFHVIGSQDTPMVNLNADTLAEDLRAAKRDALSLDKTVLGGTDAEVYVPYAPAFDGEIRIQAPSVESLTVSLRAATGLAEKLEPLLSYSVLIHFDFNFAQVCFFPKPLGTLGLISDRRTHSTLPGDFLNALHSTQQST